MPDYDYNQIGTLAHLETIRNARIEPLMLRVNKKAGLDTTSEIIYLPKLNPDRIHVITNICCIELGTGTPQIFLGIMSKGEKFYLFSDTVATAQDSVTWSGNAILLHVDQIFAELKGATAAEEAILTANGYSMRI